MVAKLKPTKVAYAILLREKERYSFRIIAKKCNISKSSAHRIWKYRQNYLRSECKEKAIVHRNKGRKPRINERDKREMLRTLTRMRKKDVNLTVMSLVREAGIDPTLVHRRTFTRYLNKWGFHFLQSRKKGLLSDKDKELRLKYAKKMRSLLKDNPTFYTHHIAFYLDGVSFIHKYNPKNEACRPKSRVWRKKGEGLSITARGTKELAGGRRLHIMVAVAYGKGVVLCQPYEKLNGEFFANFIRTHFNLTFGKAGPKVMGQRLFVMDNDPSQTSCKAMSALSDIEATLHRIPSRTQDLNPPENVFHIVKKRLEQEAITLNLTMETFDNFKERVLKCFQSIDSDLIDKTIASLPKRVENIISLCGGRTKY